MIKIPENKNELKTVGIILINICVCLLFVLNASAQNQEAEIRELQPNQTIEREMTGKETHRYKFDLKSGEFFQVRVEQKGVDVLLRLLDSDGNVLATMDSPNSKEGPETLSFISSKDGNYRLETSGFDEKAEKAIYAIKREVSRTATEKDKRRVEVEKLFVEGMTARDTEGQSDLAISKLEDALKGWKEIEDNYLENLTKQQIDQIKEANRAAFYQLEIGKIIEKSLRIEKNDVYTMELKKDSILKIEVEEKGIDVILSFVKGNTNDFIVRRDIGSGEDKESFTVKIEEDGLYGIFVLAKQTNENGKYIFTSQLNQSETEQDRIRIEAEKLLDANNLNTTNKTDDEVFKDFVKNLESSLPLWRKLNDIYWEGFTAYILGNFYLKLNDKTKAVEFYNQALPLFEKLKNDNKQFQLLTGIKEIYKELNDKAKIIETLKKEAMFWNSLNNPSLEALAYSDSAQLYESQYYNDSPDVVLDFSESVKNYEKALSIYQKLEENWMIISVAGLLSSLHNVRGNYDEAIKYSNMVLATEIKIPQGADETQKNDIVERMNDSKLFAKHTLATAYTQKGDWDKALGFYNELLSSPKNIKFNETTDLRYAARMSIGQIYFFKYESEKAIEIFQQVLADERKEKDIYHIANTLNIIGGIYFKIDQYENALRYFNESLETLNTIKDKDVFAKKLEVSLFDHIGLVHLNLGNMPESLKSFNKSLSLLSEVNDPIFIEDKSLTYNNLANYYDSIGDFPKALKYLNEALDYFHKIPAGLRNLARNRTMEALINNSMGTMYSNLGDKRESLKYYNLALDLANKANDKSIKAAVLKSLGIHWAEAGDMKTARLYIDKALILFQEIKEQNEVALTIGTIAHFYDYSGEKEKAINYYDSAIKLAREIKSKSVEMRMLANKAATYGDLGENATALELFEEASKIARFIGDKEQEGFLLNNIGAIYENLKDKQTALKHYQESALIFNNLGNNRLKSAVIGNVGRLFYELNDRENALIKLNEALRLSYSVDDKTQLTFILNTLGRVHSNSKEKDIAVKNFSEALAYAVIFDNEAQESHIFRRLMTFYRITGNERMAIFCGKLSVNNQQNLRQKVRGLDNETQKAYLKKNIERYQELVGLLINEDQTELAFQVINLFKDQQYYDFNQDTEKQTKQVLFSLREKEFVSAYDGLSIKLKKSNDELEELKRTIGTREATAEEKIQLEKLEAELKIALDEFLAVLKKAETEFSKKPDEKDLVGEVPDLMEMQTALRDLNKQTGQKAVAVYQVVGEENFSALVITPDSIEKVEVPFKGEVLNEKALQLWALLKSDRYDTTILSKEIYDVVFAPLEAKLPKDTTAIMWSLDGNLRYLPMAALFDGKRFLVERYTHSIFTRADSERMTRNVSDTWTGTGFGSSEAATVEVLGSRISFDALPGVTEELSEIFKTGDKGILTGETFAGKQFSKPNFIKALKTERPLVHIASHFAFRPGDEARSFLLMGDQTAFTLEEMKREENLFKGVELLTLSACNTAATQSGANGREIDGFAELAQRLGAGAVMATLWQVSDASTPWLMRDFYSTRETETGMTKTEALKQSQIGLLNGTAKIKPLPKAEKSGLSKDKIEIEVVPDGTKIERKSSERGPETFQIEKKNAPLYKTDDKKPFAHPYYWSPFVLYGNWK